MAKRLTVGIIDDDPDVLLALDNMLAAYDYQTELYTSAGQFLETARASRAGCLVVDIKWPISCDSDRAHAASGEAARYA